MSNLCPPSKSYYIESATRAIASSNIWSQPDVFETVMIFIVDDFDSPSHRISSNNERRVAEFLPGGTKLFGFPGFNLCLVIFSVRWEMLRQIALVRSPFVPYIQHQGS